MPNALEKSQSINVITELAAAEAAAVSLTHYKNTGLHTTLDEIKIWAKAVQLDRSVKMPPVHIRSICRR
jgi:hypothetical protein